MTALLRRLCTAFAEAWALVKSATAHKPNDNPNDEWSDEELFELAGRHRR
jgi:hypothetical protein